MAWSTASSRHLPRDLCSTNSTPGQNRSTKPCAPPSFLTFSSKVATRLLVMPKISKKSNQKGLARLSSLQASAQVLLKSNALDLISFQLRPIWCSQSELGCYWKVRFF